VLAGVDPAAKTGFFDPIKYVPLTDDGFLWASFGGQVREQFEGWNNFGFVSSDDDTFLLTRLRLHGDLHIGHSVRVFVEGISAHSTDRDLAGGNRTLDVNNADLLNAFVDVNLFPSEVTSLTFRVGRQELSFGRQRLVSPLDWANTRRTFEGASLIVRHRDWTVTGFYTQPVVVEKYSFDENANDVDFYGLYATTQLPSAKTGVDLYVLGLKKKPAGYNGTAGGERRTTVGNRVWGPIADTAFDYDTEGAYQFGDIGSGDISAFMVATQLGYTCEKTSGKPRVTIGCDYASGDNRFGGDVQTFNQLFPLAHAYTGYIDVLGRQNIIDLSTGVSLKPMAKLTVKADGHYFRRADGGDALYNAGGAPFRPGGASSSKDVGSEIDLTAKYQFGPHLIGICGYSHFFAGDFIEGSGPDSDIDFGYLTLQYTF